MRRTAILSLVVAGLLAASAQAQTQPSDADGAAVAAACGGEVQREQLMAMPKAKRVEKLSCFTREAAKRFNKTLPQKVDDVTVLQRVSAEGTILTYYSAVNVLKSDLPAGALEAFKPKVHQQVCAAADMKLIISVGGSYQYRWYDKNAEAIGETTVSSCP